MTVIPLAAIEAKRKEVDPTEFIVRCILAIPMLVGWSAAKVWLLVTYFVAAIAVGWEKGLGKTTPSGTP